MKKTQLLSQPFENIHLKGKKQKTDFLTSIVTELLKHNLTGIVIIEKTFKPIGFGKFDHLNIHSKNGLHLYCIDKPDQVQDIVELLIKVKPWSRGGFTMIFGGTELPSILTRNYQQIKGRSIPDLEAFLDHEINGYFFPLDDELLFYGREPFRKTIEFHINKNK